MTVPRIRARGPRSRRRAPNRSTPIRCSGMTVPRMRVHEGGWGTPRGRVPRNSNSTRFFFSYRLFWVRAFFLSLGLRHRQTFRVCTFSLFWHSCRIIFFRRWGLLQEVASRPMYLFQEIVKGLAVFPLRYFISYYVLLFYKEVLFPTTFLFQLSPPIDFFTPPTISKPLQVLFPFCLLVSVFFK